MKTIGFMLQLTRELWGNWKAAIMRSIFCVIKGILEMSNRGVYGILLIKNRHVWFRGVTSSQNILLVWDVIVVNGMRQSLIFLKESD